MRNSDHNIIRNILINNRLKTHLPEYFKVILLVLLSLLHIRYGVIPAWLNINSDFPNYYTSARLMMERKDIKNIYNDKWFQQKIFEYGINEQGKFSPFPPATVFVMFPEALFSPITAKRIFLVLNIIIIILTAYILRKITGFSFIGVLNIILLSGIALINNLLFGQFYLVLLFLIITDYYLFIKRERNITGILWGIAASIKYVTVIYIPVILLKKRRDTLILFISSILAVNLITMLIVGYDVYIRFIQFVLFAHLNGNLSSQSEYAVQFQSWNSFLRNVFVYDKIKNIHPIVNSVLLFNMSRIFINSIFLIISGIVIYKFRNNENIIPVSFIILTQLIIVLAPASASYHLLLMVLPFALLLRFTHKKFPFYNFAFSFLFILIFFSPLMLNKYNEHNMGLILSYSRLWLEVILFIITIIFINYLEKYNNTEIIYSNLNANSIEKMI